MPVSFSRSFLCASVLALCATAAQAQQGARPDEINARPRAKTSAAVLAKRAPTPVADRPRPAYDPEGIRFGDLVLYPSIMATLSRDDNLFASRAARASDVIFTLTPLADRKSTRLNSSH